MSHQSRCLIAAITLGGLAACATPGQRVGQSATVQFGVVRSAEEITLDSAAAQGALVGGTLGLAAGRGNSLSNAIRGATVGGAALAASQGDRRGVAYSVVMVDGSSVRIVSDQREIRPGDCVAVERVRDTANIRRASASYCDAENQRAVAELGVAVREDADKCGKAKQELSEARDAEEADLAGRKVGLLCDN